jgi:hypothetical protein
LISPSTLFSSVLLLLLLYWCFLARSWVRIPAASYAVYLIENQLLLLIEDEVTFNFYFPVPPSSFWIYVGACVESFIHLRETEREGEKQNGGIYSIYIK